MTTVTNSSADDWYLPTVGVTLKPGESWSDDDPAPELPADVKPSKAKDTPKTDPAPEPAEPATVPADTQES